MSETDFEPRRVTISDPQIMRALAHPARLAIMDHLTSTGASVTATEAAEVTGLSPSAMSYHLRELAKAGLIREAPGQGDARERRWQGTFQGWSVEAGQDADEDARAAETALIEAYLARDVERVRGWARRAPDEPKQWYDATSISESTLLVTAEELAELNAAVLALFEPYQRRNRIADPPEGSRTVVVQYRGIPVG
ncbi:MAG TPA: helix-turn-helix domain-containing protein [Micromonosporaceae bacterium]|nr:helix-turn-helix domain-containing protein [Micromonosporaceae bacterium]